MNKSVSLLILIILSFTNFAFAQSKRPARKAVSINKNEAIQKTNYLTSPFKSDVDYLTPHFLGHNANLVFLSLIPLAIETQKGCGKFEKKQQCQDRLNELYDRTLWKDFTARDLLAFSIPIDCDYDADAEKFRCSNFLSDYMWSHKKIGSSSYVGENAFGVKKLVKYEKFENIIIEVDKIKPDFTIENIPPNEAKKLSSNLRLLIIGETLQPFVKSKTVSYKPTIDEPSHTEGNNKFVVIELKEVWIYDFETGKIFAKKEL